MNNRFIIPFLFIAGSVSFMLIPFLSAPDDDDSRAWNELPQYFLLLLFFYLNYFLLVPKLYFNGRYVLYFLLVFAAMITVPYLSRLTSQPEMIGVPPDFPGPAGEDGNRPSFFLRINHNVFLFLAVTLASLLLRIQDRWRKSEKEIITARLSLLREQINPHFLFNTLNSIYLLAIEKSEETPQAILKLSDMMRYVLNENAHEKVPLEKELQYLENFIDLQKTRFRETLPVQFKVSGDLSERKIAPLLLITFVENAFKHGVNAAEENFIDIEINIDAKNHLQLKVENRIVKVFEENEGSRIGLQNTKNRLELLYPGRHRLKINNDGEKYLISLDIDLT